jgi:hypothetical protein
MPQKPPPERSESEEDKTAPKVLFTALASKLLKITPEELEEEQRKWQEQKSAKNIRP